MSVLKLKQNGKWVPISVGAQGIQGPAGANGATGTTFTPSVSADGTLSWTNDGGKDNPASVNIKGPQGVQGPQGEPGATGPQGPAGKTPVKGTDYFTAADKSEIAQAAAELVSVPSASSTTPKAPGTASAGSESAYARGDHVHPRELPNVTTADNGKFLRVVSGAWADAEIANANGGSF